MFEHSRGDHLMVLNAVRAYEAVRAGEGQNHQYGGNSGAEIEMWTKSIQRGAFMLFRTKSKRPLQGFINSPYVLLETGSLPESKMKMKKKDQVCG